MPELNRKSIYDPGCTANMTLESCTENVREILVLINKRSESKGNVSPRMRRALKALMCQKNIDIRKADKDSVIVMKDYVHNESSMDAKNPINQNCDRSEHEWVYGDGIQD